MAISNRRYTHLALILVLLSACSDQNSDAATEQQAEQANAASVTIDTGFNQMQAQYGADLQLPSDFPKEIPLPNNYSIESIVQMGERTNISLRTTGKHSHIYSVFRRRLKTSGWAEKNALDTADSAVLDISKKDLGIVIVFAPSPNNDGLLISVSYGPAK